MTSNTIFWILEFFVFINHYITWTPMFCSYPIFFFPRQLDPRAALRLISIHTAQKSQDEYPAGIFWRFIAYLVFSYILILLKIKTS